MYVSEIWAEGIFVTFPWWLKNVKSRSKIALQNERYLEIWFPKRKQLSFSKVNYLNYTKKPNFACGNYIFPKTRGNKIEPWTHSIDKSWPQTHFIVSLLGDVVNMIKKVVVGTHRFLNISQFTKSGLFFLMESKIIHVIQDELSFHRW